MYLIFVNDAGYGNCLTVKFSDLQYIAFTESCLSIHRFFSHHCSDSSGWSNSCTICCDNNPYNCISDISTEKQKPIRYALFESCNI